MDGRYLFLENTTEGLGPPATRYRDTGKADVGLSQGQILLQFAGELRLVGNRNIQKAGDGSNHGTDVVGSALSLSLSGVHLHLPAKIGNGLGGNQDELAGIVVFFYLPQAGDGLG